MKKYQLFAPGPTPVPSEALLAMAQPIIHHRTPAYEAVSSDVRTGLRRLFRTSQEVLVLACSGTGVMEAALTNTRSPGDTVVVVTAGKFGERWIELARAFGVTVVEIAAPYGETVPAVRVAEVLRTRPEIRAVFCQHSESSTGVLHDVRGYAEAARETETLLVVDAVSSLGIAELPMDAWGIDVVVAGSQKGLMLPPGLGFVALSERAWEHARRATLPRYYFDLLQERAWLEKGEPRFTPAVSIVIGLRQVLRMLEAEGLDQVFARHQRLAQATRAGVQALGLALFARTSPSPALTAVVAPRGIDSEKIVAAYSEAHNITIAGGQGAMKGKVFRLGHMGYVAEFDVLTALAALEQVLDRLGVPVTLGAGIGAAQRIFAGRA